MRPLRAALRLATLPVIVIDDVPFAPLLMVRPLVEPSVNVPSATTIERESEFDVAAPSVKLIALEGWFDAENVAVVFSLTSCAEGAVIRGVANELIVSR